MFNIIRGLDFSWFQYKIKLINYKDIYFHNFLFIYLLTYTKGVGNSEAECNGLLSSGKFLADNIVGSVVVFSLIFWIPLSILVHCVVSVSSNLFLLRNKRQKAGLL